MTTQPPDANGEDPALALPWSVKQDREEAEYQAGKRAPLPPSGRAKVSPAAALRKRCKEAIKSLAYLGSRPLWEPRVTAGKVHFANSKREFLIGNKGQRDVVVTWFGHAFHFELKAGRDRMQDSQIAYGDFVRRSHGTDAEIRDPKQMVDAMMRWYETHPATVAEAKRDQVAA